MTRARRRARPIATWPTCVLAACLCAATFLGNIAPACAQATALMRYNAIAESIYLVDRCGAMTAERRVYLQSLLETAKRPLQWSDAQWAQHDSALAADLPRLNPDVPPVRCAELVRSLDQEMKAAASRR